jgi:hypothetical protein
MFVEEIEGLTAPYLCKCPDQTTLGYSLAQGAVEAVICAMIQRGHAATPIIMGIGIAAGSVCGQSGARALRVGKSNLLNGFAVGCRASAKAQEKRDGRRS